MLGGLLLTGVATRANAGEWNQKTYVTITQSIEVPGAVMPPAKYVFKLLDSASDRHIVQIMNAEDNRIYSTILAAAEPKMPQTAGDAAALGLFGLCRLGMAVLLRMTVGRAGRKA
jgi:hypothetical protein